VKVLVTGTQGQVARALAERAAGSTQLRLAFLGRPEFDLERPETIRTAVRREAPDLIVSAAAWTAVDQAEDEPARARLANVDAPEQLALAAKDGGAKLIHLSTDYVFGGDSDRPYRETDPVGPLGVYGQTKLDGETKVRAAGGDWLILRTAWVYSPFGKNFVKTMLTAAKTRNVMRVVGDQRGNPTSALDIADAILQIAHNWQTGGRTGLGSIFHCTASGETTWAALASYVFDVSRSLDGPVAQVEPIATSEWPTRARRPANSRLDCSALREAFAIKMPDWRDSVRTTVERLLKEEAKA
jgi:dTDP-4-dehydrorhamnose reductase